MESRKSRNANHYRITTKLARLHLSTPQHHITTQKPKPTTQQNVGNHSVNTSEVSLHGFMFLFQYRKGPKLTDGFALKA